MLNSVLTVRAHTAFSHQGIGWEKFTDAVINILNEQDKPIVYLLWGKPAEKKQLLLIIKDSCFLRHHIQVHYLLTEDFSDVIILVKRMNFL